MTTEIECKSCNLTLLAFESLGPNPIGREDCPNCGHDEFSLVE